MSEEQTNTPTEGTVTTPQSQAPALTVADLRNVRAIIDLSSSRGSFRGAELKTVGEVYEKLDAFLKQVDADQAKKDKTSEDKAVTPTPTATEVTQ
jgi:hypothetical protein